MVQFQRSRTQMVAKLITDQLPRNTDFDSRGARLYKSNPLVPVREMQCLARERIGPVSPVDFKSTEVVTLLLNLSPCQFRHLPHALTRSVVHVKRSFALM